jgi:Predicted ATPase
MDSIGQIIKEGYESAYMPLPDITEWSRIAPELLKNNDYEAIRTTKYRYLRAYNIIHHRDAPDPEPLFPDTFDMDMEDAITDSNEFDWHKATEILAHDIKFAFTDELLYYNPENGVWENDAERIILYALDRAYKGRITRHIESEVISEIKREGMVIGDFSQKQGYINCKNGVINIQDGTIHKHSPEYRFRYVIPVRYDYKARAEKILKFLEDVFKDDLNKALKTLEIFAEPFIPGYPIQKAITLLGRGNNGKSVTLSILSALLGKKNIASIPLQSIAHNRFASVELQYKLANISGDVSGGRLQDTSTFKMLTGGIMCQGKGKICRKELNL